MSKSLKQISSLIKMQENNPRSSRYFITMNNYTDEAIIYIRSEAFKRLCKYYILGFEEAPSSGTKHFHLYIRLNQRMYRNTIKCLIPNSVIEVAKGDEQQCFNYCSKTGNYEEYGERLKKVDEYVSKIEKFKEMLNDLMTLKWQEFEAKWPYESYHQKKKLEEWKYSHEVMKEPWNGELQMKNIWIYGEPGCGKSRWAHQQDSEDKIYLKNVNKWWDGYKDGEFRLVIIEDFPVDNKDWLINILKIWSDRYPFNGEVKGGTVRVTPGRWYLIVTSNHSIEEVFGNCQEQDVRAIKRRFHEIKMEPGSIIQWARVPQDQLDQ